MEKYSDESLRLSIGCLWLPATPATNKIASSRPVRCLRAWSIIGFILLDKHVSHGFYLKHYDKSINLYFNLFQAEIEK